MKEMVIDGIKYVPETATELKGMKYCIVRTYSAGVFAGYVESRNGREVVIRDVRRIYYWSGANSLSQLAMEGTAKPEECKFAMLVDKIEALETIEIIECTKKAQDNIEGVAEWKI